MPIPATECPATFMTSPKPMDDAKPDSDQADYGQVFDREQELLVNEHSRPHWMQAGTITFNTMRLTDSIPREFIVHIEFYPRLRRRRRHVFDTHCRPAHNTSVAVGLS